MTEPTRTPAFVDAVSALLREGTWTDVDARRYVDSHLSAALEISPYRVRELPPIIVENKGPYLDMLLEARWTYILSMDYACLAMCGIVGERLLKDVLTRYVSAAAPSESVRAPDDRSNHFKITEFLAGAAVIDGELKQSFLKLAHLRNAYAHGCGPDSHGDSLTAIRLLHAIVERTVSLLERHPTLLDKVIARVSSDRQN